MARTGSFLSTSGRKARVSQSLRARGLHRVSLTGSDSVGNRRQLWGFPRMTQDVFPKVKVTEM